MRPKITANDLLNFIVSAGLAGFSLLIGGSWFFGLLVEPEKAENFLLMVSFGLFLSGIGLALNCYYLATKKIYKFIYYIALVIMIVGYGLALLGQAIYRSS